MQTTVSARGPLPADAVWERYADLDRWREWAPQITAVDAHISGQPSRRLAPGLRGTVKAVGVVHVGFEVLDVDDAARTWSWRVRLGPIRMRLVHGVEPDAGGTRTWLSTDGPAPVVLAYTPLAFVALHALVA